MIVPGALLAALLAASCSPKPSPAPVASEKNSLLQLPDVVHFVAGDEWFMRRVQGAPEGTGWVQLPEPVKNRPYVSGIDPFVKGFVRPEVCGECHADIHDSFRHTAHYRTAAEATEEVVLGSFAAGQNELKTRDADLWFTMLNDDDQLRQRVTLRRSGELYTLNVPMDICTGSGNHGQTFLYWHGDELYEMPVSYFTELDRWVNSPGLYSDGTADFGRPIGDRCLDCHATYFAIAPGSKVRFDRNNYILGVTCVRCHGAGWAHVQYHQHHEDEPEARYIVNPAQLSVERANEICAQCHSGQGKLLKPAFTYQPGQPLAEHITLDFSGDNPDNDDPHAANQLARLMKSPCFAESGTLTCFNCHNPHAHERGDLALHSRRCAQCHETGDCGLSHELGAALQTRCVLCHMASRRDAEGIIETPNGVVLPLLRDHYIQARPAATKEIVEQLRAELRPEGEGPPR